MKILIVVDMQNDFITGSLGTAQARAIVPNVRAKIAEYNECDDTIVFTQDTHWKDYLLTQEGKNLPVEHCILGTDGWRIHGELDKDSIRCHFVNKSSFGWANWKYSLECLIDDVEEIELVGVCTGICVVSNALILKATYPEIKITVDASCCACVSEESHRAALLVMKTCQVNVTNEGGE